MGCFFFLLVVGGILYFVLKGRGDRQEALGASHRPMGSGPLQPVTFACPYPKCPTCGGATDKMKQSWDGMRKVTWNCGYCGNVAGIQELKDEELPASARQRLGLDQPMGGQGFQGPGPGYHGGGGIGGMVTGMMIGSMLSGGHEHHHHHDDDGFSSSSGSSDSDWGGGSGDGGGSSDWGSSDSGGGDWGGGDSGGGDSGGSDW